MKDIGVKMSGSKSNNGRQYFDFYPTPKEVTIALCEHFEINNKKVLEPACGDGSMSIVLENYGNDVCSCDIRKKEEGVYGIPETDYLKTEFNGFDCIITNPPFYISEQFIMKALSESPFVAMLLKGQYWHAKSRYSLFEKQKPSYVMPLTWRPNFFPEKKSGSVMEMVWTVWDSKKFKGHCKYVPLLKPSVSQKMF